MANDYTIEIDFATELNTEINLIINFDIKYKLVFSQISYWSFHLTVN